MSDSSIVNEKGVEVDEKSVVLNETQQVVYNRMIELRDAGTQLTLTA